PSTCSIRYSLHSKEVCRLHSSRNAIWNTFGPSRPDGHTYTARKFPDTHSYIHRLKRFMSQSTPVYIRQQATKSHVPPDMSNWTHVTPQSSPPYMGPFRVIRKSAKYFTIDKNGKPVNITSDQLKQAFLENDSVFPDSSIPSPYACPRARHRRVIRT
ncbi:uncharacterized protein LOC115217640, partial [Argonauta hians]